MNVRDDAFEIATELLNDHPYEESFECNFARERKYPVLDQDVIYSLPETPDYLEELGLIEILGTKSYFYNKDMSNFKRELTYSYLFWDDKVKGLMAVAFNLKKLRIWREKEVQKRIMVHDIDISELPEGWCWINKEKREYQFGEHGVFSQKGDARGKVFVELMELFSMSPKGISINSLSERTGGITKDKLRIEISGINTRLKVLGLKWYSNGKGYYQLKALSKET